MLTGITGVVTDGVIIPSSPLPEGLQVEIHLQPIYAEVWQEMQEEFAAWEQASAEALALVERLADEGPPYEKR